MSQPLPEQNNQTTQNNQNIPNQTLFTQNHFHILEWVCAYVDAQFCLTTKTQYQQLNSFVPQMVQEGNKLDTFQIVENETNSKQEHKEGKQRKSSIGCISVISRQCKTEINELKALRVKIEAQKQLIDQQLKYQNQTVNLNKRTQLKDEDKSSTIFVIREQKEKRGKSLRKFVSNIEKSMNGSDHSFENKSKKKYPNSFMIAPHELSNKWSEDKSRAVQQSFASEKKQNSIKYKIDGHRMLQRQINLEYEKRDVLLSEKDSKIPQKSFAISSKRPTSRSRSITNSFKSNLKQDSSNNKSSFNPSEDYKKLDAKLKLMENKLKAVEKKQKKLQQIEKIMKDETESSKLRQSEGSRYKDKSELPSKPSIVNHQKIIQQLADNFKVHQSDKAQNKGQFAPKRKSFSIKNANWTKNEQNKNIQKKLGLTSLTVNYNLSEEMMKVRKQEQEIKNKQKLQQEVMELKKTIRQLRIEKIKQQDIIKILYEQKQHINQYHSKPHNQHPGSSFDFTTKQHPPLSASGRTQKFPYSDNGNKMIIGNDQKRQSRLYSSIVKNIPNNSETTSTKRRQCSDIEFPNENIENEQIMSSQIKGIKRRGLIVRQILKEQKLGFGSQLNSKDENEQICCDKKIADNINISDLNVDINQSQLKQQTQGSQNLNTKLQQQNNPPLNSQQQHLSKIHKQQTQSFQQNIFHYHQQKLNQFQKPIIQIPQVQVLQSMPFLVLPTPPSIQSTFNEVLEKVKDACQITQTSIGKKEDLQMKKFKNCIILKQKQTDKAIVWHYSGKFYIGGWNQTTSKEDSKNGDGYQFVPEKYTYRGSFENGRRNGLGIMISANGNIYKGEWSQGQKNGLGTFQEKSIGCTYVGNWKDGKKEGKGIVKKSQKQFYVGQFQKSLKSGTGKEIFSNGDIYEGQYLNGRFDGNGKYFWANESMYVGQFKNGERQGLGKWKSNYLNGDIYIGPYCKDKKEGEGRYQWDNGCVYEGGFEKDMKSGLGKISYPDGRIVDGIWENGKITEVIKKSESKIESKQMIGKQKEFHTKQ